MKRYLVTETMAIDLDEVAMVKEGSPNYFTIHLRSGGRETVDKTVGRKVWNAWIKYYDGWRIE